MKSSSTFYLTVPGRRLRAEESDAFYWGVLSAPEQGIRCGTSYLNLMSDI
jgi:hypothetical protein